MANNLPPMHSLSHPPLESRDRLSRPEFERRYTATKDVRKAELISAK